MPFSSVTAALPFFSLTILKSPSAPLTFVFNPSGVFKYSKFAQLSNISFVLFLSAVTDVSTSHLPKFTVLTALPLNNPLISRAFDTSQFDTSGFADLAPLNTSSISTTFDVFHFDTSGFADSAPSNMLHIRVTFDMSQLDTSGFTDFAPINMLLISVTLDVFSLSAPIKFPLNLKNIYVQSSGKYTSLSTFMFPVNIEFSQSKFSAPPNSFTISIHLSRSMFLSSVKSSTLIVILPSLPTLVLTLSALFSEKRFFLITAYTLVSLLTIVFSSKSGTAAVLLLAQPKHLCFSISGNSLGNSTFASFILLPFSTISWFLNADVSALFLSKVTPAYLYLR